MTMEEFQQIKPDLQKTLEGVFLQYPEDLGTWIKELGSGIPGEPRD